MKSSSVILTFLGTLTTNSLIEREMNNPDIETVEPIDTVTIIVPSYNEELFIETSLSSIRNQSIMLEYPHYFEIILVDSGSKDKTIELAKPYVDKVIYANRGKLTARNLATDKSKGNIIVSVDSDSYYPHFWLNTLLKPFNNPNIIAVVGSTYDPSIPMIPTYIRNLAEILDRKILNPNQMVGRNSAYRKRAFYLTGKFDESINQINVSKMVQEEEVEFGNRLAKLGKVVFKLNANCTHLGGTKIGCRWGLVNKESCSNYGINIERFG